MRCRLCEKTKKLVKAHIIPEAFFRVLRDGTDPPRIVSNMEGTYPKRSPVGVYDRTIVCQSCEQIFGDWDSAAARLFIHSFHKFREIQHDGITIAYQVDSPDYARLKLFFISVLWRASVSAHPFYDRVRLGPYEREARTMILAREPGSPDQFSVLMSRWQVPDKLASLVDIIMDPHKERWEGVNSYRLYLGKYLAYIKVDQRPFPKALQDFVLAPRKPLVIILRDLASSNDLKAMRNVAQALRR